MCVKMVLFFYLGWIFGHFVFYFDKNLPNTDAVPYTKKRR